MLRLTNKALNEIALTEAEDAAGPVIITATPNDFKGIVAADDCVLTSSLMGQVV